MQVSAVFGDRLRSFLGHVGMDSPCLAHRSLQSLYNVRGDASTGASAPVHLKKGHCLSELGFAFLVVL